jgi:hypothetical protein
MPCPNGRIFQVRQHAMAQDVRALLSNVTFVAPLTGGTERLLQNHGARQAIILQQRNDTLETRKRSSATPKPSRIGLTAIGIQFLITEIHGSGLRG